MRLLPVETARILVVDDLPEKLLVYRSVLEEPGQEVIAASSGEEALRLVLRHDFAVILLDVNMPGMDGFETAKLIRGRKRCAHTPIIFVTAHADELHTLQGYTHGAVDFILAPVIPDILRTKVRVFVQLFRLNQQVREQAARQVAVAEREQAHLSDLLERATDFVARVDPQRHVTVVNRCGRTMLGYNDRESTPRLLSDFYPPWAEAVLRDHGLPTAQREGIWFGEAALRIRDGREVPVSQVILAHSTAEGELEHFSIVARDISKRRSAEQALTESEQRYRQLVQGLPAAAYTCDTKGKITLYNGAAVELWGREPVLGEDCWCGSWRIYRADGVPLEPENSPMAIAIREGRPVRGEEIIIERQDGGRRNVLPYPEPIRDSSGTIIGAVNMLVDITDRKAAERALRESESRLRAMLGQAAVGIALLDCGGRFMEVNGRLAQIVGRSVEELCTLTCRALTYPDDWLGNGPMIDEVVSGRRAELTIEKRYVRGDGTLVWVNVAMSPLLDDYGRVRRLIAVVEDISARKHAEEEVHRHREHLELLVRERTAELEASHERLRLADRLASVGTLAAGLGHDMGNLLLPVRMRVEALGRMPLSAAAREDVSAIADACEYLKRLSQGLRLFALNPEDGKAAGEHTHLASWWADVAPFLRNALHRGQDLKHDLPENLPAIAMAPHLLTQAVYNLVQNAGDAMKDRKQGRLEITAALRPDGGSIDLAVSDDGPGMSESVLKRCMEPFFTTKTRGISTGLGLALVHGAVRKAGGLFEIRSRPGEGTTCRMILPVYGPPSSDATLRHKPMRAHIQLADPRMRAYVDSVLRSLNVEIVSEPWSRATRSALILLDDPGARATEVMEFVTANPASRVVQFGGVQPENAPDRWIVIESHPPAAQVRSVLRVVVATKEPEMQEASA